MYKLLLILRYLRRKLAPLFAAAAVMLCTAMVIIVISVMGGFLELMRDAAQKLTGDVTVRADVTGFPHYEQMLEEFRGLVDVAEATAVARAYGLVHLHGSVLTIEVAGIDPDGLDRVTGYRETLYWTAERLVGDEQKPEKDGQTAYEVWQRANNKALADLDWKTAGMTFRPPDRFLGHTPAAASSQDDERGIVLGIEVNPFNERDETGQYKPGLASLGQEVTLTVLPLTQRGTLLEPSVRRLIVVNEFKSGLYDIDANRVYAPFSVVQRMLKMDPAVEADPETGKPTGLTIPGRTTEIMVRGHEGVPVGRVAAAVRSVAERYMGEYPDMPVLWIQTWEERHARMLGAVEKEKGLLTVLFGIISIVAVAMIAVIFYMIVLEKTRDIGVLRTLGASRGGVVGIFLGYGLTIGVLGASLGLALAAAVVWNLNEIQDALYHSILWATDGRVEFRMWDPRVYYFDQIPNRLNPVEVTVILVSAVLSSVLGSVVPAFVAGRVDPVKSLRYE